jgi:hypothetical protein
MLQVHLANLHGRKQRRGHRSLGPLLSDLEKILVLFVSRSEERSFGSVVLCSVVCTRPQADARTDDDHFFEPRPTDFVGLADASRLKDPLPDVFQTAINKFPDTLAAIYNWWYLW